MDIVEEMVDIPTQDGPMATATYRPDGGGLYPAVIVIQEAFGLTQHIMDVAKRAANEGYVAAAPDLFHRAGRLRTAPYDRLAEFRDALRKGFSDASVAMDVEATVRYLQTNPHTGGPIGIVGFCMGGRVVLLAAEKVDGLAAGVIYYGGNMVPPDDAPPGTPSLLDQVSNIRIPLVGFFGEKDRNPSPIHVAKLDDALTRHGVQHAFHSYTDAGHGFFCDERDSYRPQAATHAWEKTLTFFAKHLKMASVP